MRARQRTAAVAILRMGDGNARHHLNPVCAALAPETVLIVRPSRQPGDVYGPNAVVIDTSLRLRTFEVVWTSLVGLAVALRSRPSYLISFNGIPYGMVSTWIGWITRTAVHVGFVGTETTLIQRRRWLLRLFGPIALATTTGRVMSDDLRSSGLTTDIHELGHGVDAARFRSDPSIPRDIDVVFVGRLIPVKRVALIVRALVAAVAEQPSLRAAIVGTGPDEADLRALATSLGLDEHIEFVGHDPAPERWLQRSKTLLLTSSREGLPFVVVEAMRCGVVPITTDVGSVTDLVHDGRSGIVLDRDPSVSDVSAAIVALITDHERLQAMRTAAEAVVSELTYDDLSRWWANRLAEAA